MDGQPRPLEGPAVCSGWCLGLQEGLQPQSLLAMAIILVICLLSWKILGEDLAAQIRASQMRRSAWGKGQSGPFGHQVLP